jgi:hypothetical protein
LIGPSRTIGATIPVDRRPATSVVVLRWPCGKPIRDKIAASKKKGLWMGGPVPLGYQVIERKLVPVAEGAERVRTIMRRYIASSSANSLIAHPRTPG